MIQRRIGDRTVGEVGLGGVQFSLADERDDALSIRTIHAAIDAGITLIDTAHAYTTLSEPTHNESLIRRALATHANSASVLVATKGGHWRASGSSFPIDGTLATLERHLKQSLVALRVDAIDLYQLHHPDPNLPIEESVGALAEFQKRGLIRQIGLSNVDRTQVDRALGVARIVSVQNAFSPFETRDLDLLTHLEGLGIAYLAHSPFGGAAASSGLRDSLPRTGLAADARGVSIHRLLLAWELSVSPNLIPVVGARRAASIVDSAHASDTTLATQESAAIDHDLAALRALHERATYVRS